ncbi:MAG: DUF559 domain-containing protein [Mycobacterium sp.]|nr:DUF559 domain-containing protein [Mycobacterium sp.]
MDNLAWPFRASEALDAGALTTRELRRFHTAVYPGVWVPRGVDLTAADRALGLVDGGAESPQETRLRLIVVTDGVPRPQTQIEFHDDYGKVMIRVDMGWPDWKVAVEYDGAQHWTDGRQRAWDIERIAMLEALGWTVIRVSADMLRRPDVIVARVREKLRAAGCPQA